MAGMATAPRPPRRSISANSLSVGPGGMEASGHVSYEQTWGCAPPPGTYDPLQSEKYQGGVVDKSERFKNARDAAADGVNVSTISSVRTPVKQLFAAPQSGKKMKLPTSADSIKIKELEREIRRLLKEHGDKERLLSQKEADFRKHDSLSFKEITHLKDEASQVLAHMLADLQKLDSHVVALENNVSIYHDFMQTVTGKSDQHRNEKVPMAKRKDDGIPIEELSQKMKDEKLSVDNKLKLMKKKSEGLQQRFSRALEDFCTSTKLLKGTYSSVMEEHCKLQQEMSAVRDQLQEAINTRTSLEQHRDNLLDSNGCLQDQVKQMSAEHTDTAEDLRILTTNMEGLQAGTVVLQIQLHDLQTTHETTCKETADKLHYMEEREVIVNETTANLHERIVELQAQNEDLAATLKETGELLCRTKDENYQLEESLNQAELKWESDKKLFLIQVEELVFEKSRTESELDHAEVNLKQMEADMVNQKSQSTDQVEALTNQLDSEKAELMQLQNKLGDLVYEKSQLHMNVGHLEAQLKLVKSESEESVMEANKTREVIPELKHRIETLHTERNVIEKRAAAMSEQNDTLQTTLERFQADFDNYSKNVDQEKSESLTKIVMLMEEIDGLKEQKDHMAQELDDWFIDKSELDIEIAKLQCRIKVVEMESGQVKQECEEEMQEYRNQVDRVTTEKQQMEKDMEQYGIDLLSNAAQLQSLQTSLESTTSDLQKLEAENAGFKDDLKLKDTALNDRGTELAELQLLSNSTTRDLQKLEVENAGLVEKQTQLTELHFLYNSKCKECDKLSSDNDQLSDDMIVQRENYEDIDCRLQQTRADFIKRCDERDELLRKNEVKDKSLAIMSQQVAELVKELEDVNVTLKTRTGEHDELLVKFREDNKQWTLASQQVSNYKQQIEDYKEHLQLKCDECDDLQEKCDDYDVELSMSAKEVVDLHERVESLRKESETTESELVDKYEHGMKELKAQLEGACGNEDLQAELDKYRMLYEELQAKVEPFMDQIDAFEMEKQLLLGMNKDTQAEMERLGRNYAQLLGHQNQKQKIKHIEKIKDQNLTLKRENMALKEQTAKQKRVLQKYEEKTAPKRFDPSKAFSHTKENLNTSAIKSPLKDLNRK